MSEPPPRPSARRPWWQWGALALLAWGLWTLLDQPTRRRADDGRPEAALESEPGGGEVPAAVAHVQGQVLVEVPRTPVVPEPVVVVLDEGSGDEDEGEGEDEGETDWVGEGEGETDWADEGDGAATDWGGEDEGTGDPAWIDDDEPMPEPSPVDLRPPPVGSCQVIAWQSGTQVSDPTPCAADGAFDVPLHPGAHGRTAFEILVPGHLRAVLEVDVPESGSGRLPPVALGQAETLSGSVVDGRGEPLEDIVVEAMPRPNLHEPEPWRATSGPDGAFAFHTLPPGPITLRARAPGHATSVLEAIAPQTELLVTLQALVDMRGRVVGSPEAVARARVRIEGSGVWPVREEAVRPDGSFVLPGIPDGIYALEAVVEAHEPGEVELASIPLENVTPELAITLALVPAHRVPVEVRDPEGDPVDGARVVLSNSSVGLLPRIALTDDWGMVEIGPVVPGPYVIRADAEGLLPSPPVALTVDGDEMVTQVLVLARPGRISGRVVDEDGRPVASARVELSADHLFTLGEGEVRARFAQASLRAAGSLGVTTGPVPEVPLDGEEAADTGSSVLTDADGGYAFGGLAPGVYRLEASHGHYARSDEVELRLGAGGARAGVELVLRTGHRLTGRVLDGNERPVEGALVRFDDGRRVLTDERGVFDGGVRRGRQQLLASAPGLAPRSLEVWVRDDPVDVEIQLARARARLSGRIEGGNGEPLPNARITLRTLDGLSPTRIEWTDERGLYRFEDLPAGPVELEVDHPDHGPTVQRVELRDEDADEVVDLELAQGWSIEIEVRLAGTREPLAGARVEGGGHGTHTDAEGLALLRNLVDERVRVEVSAEGYGRRTLWVEHDGADRQARRVELSEGGSLSGRVTDYRGEAVPGVEVSVRGPDGDALGLARTDASGQWSLDGIPAGDVVVSVDPPLAREDELRGDRVDTDVLRGRETRGVDLRLDRR
ncbi:MAG: carboxypeptidase regulatory-like domain-containing protein [Myxococcales bacterium]|nr:carboxypeptidase regulatory-like domain-containing protein [Myxococcales bacterium]